MLNIGPWPYINEPRGAQSALGHDPSRALIYQYSPRARLVRRWYLTEFELNIFILGKIFYIFTSESCRFLFSEE